MPRKTTDVSQQEGARQDEAPRMAWPGGKIVSNAAEASDRFFERMSGKMDVLDNKLRTAIRAAAVQRSRWTREELNKKLSQGLRARLEELVNEYRHDPSPESRQRVRMIPNRPAEWQPLWVYIGRPSGGAANRLPSGAIGSDGEFGNPFVLTVEGDRNWALVCHRLLWEAKSDDEKAKIRSKLRDKMLVCWCGDLGCHGHLLAEECNNDDESGAAEDKEAAAEQEATEKDEIDFGPLACGIQAAYEKALEARTLRQPSKK